MEKQFTAQMLNDLRKDLNEAVKSVGDKHGLTIHFGNATFDALSATYKVNVGFVATDDYDPAKELWERYCNLIGLEKEDYGKVFSFPFETKQYKIVGIQPNARTNSVLIQQVDTGKEYVCSPMQVRSCLGRTTVQEANAPKSPDQDPVAKKNWDMYLWKTGLAQDDFGKIITLSDGKQYQICGVKPNARVNTILIRNTATNKEYVTSPGQVNKALGRMK